jgi:hypothetical protein
VYNKLLEPSFGGGGSVAALRILNPKHNTFKGLVKGLEINNPAVSLPREAVSGLLGIKPLGTNKREVFRER